MDLKIIETPGIAHYAYLISDGNEAAIVDPRRDIDDYLTAAREAGARIKYVIETHRQEDFVMGSAALASATGATIVNGEHELFGHGDRRLGDGERFQLGDLTIRALHTPGHTPESMSYAVYASNATDSAWCVFTGDTLFFGTTGRTDLPDEDKSVENAALLYDSVHEKIAGLGDTTLILPAHGPGSVCGSGMAQRPVSTLGEEKRYNDVFTLDREDFAQKKGGEQLPRPPYFRHMEKVNLEGGVEPVLKPGSVRLLGPDEFDRKGRDQLVFDTREPEGFAGGHLANSHSIWLSGLPVFGGWVADAESPILLLTDRNDDVDTEALHLSRIGLDNVEGALAGGFGAWRKSGKPISSAGTITPRELRDERDRFQILDVREPDEFAQGHLPGAHELFVGYTSERIERLELDRDEPVVVTCSVGHRAGLGVSLLLREGFRDVRNLLGGMTAWKALEFPVEKT